MGLSLIIRLNGTKVHPQICNTRRDTLWLISWFISFSFSGSIDLCSASSFNWYLINLTLSPYPFCSKLTLIKIYIFKGSLNKNMAQSTRKEASEVKIKYPTRYKSAQTCTIPQHSLCATALFWCLHHAMSPNAGTQCCNYSCSRKHWQDYPHLIATLGMAKLHYVVYNYLKWSLNKLWA